MNLDHVVNLCHLTNYKLFISTSKTLINKKLLVGRWYSVKNCQLPSFMSLWPHVSWQNKSGLFPFHMTCKHQTWHSIDLGQGVSTCQVTCPFDHMVTWCYVIKMLYLHFPKASNLAQWWHRVGGFHLLINMSFFIIGSHDVTWQNLMGFHSPSCMFLWWCGQVISLRKTKTLYHHFHKT